jgi:hypothetical protein
MPHFKGEFSWIFFVPAAVCLGFALFFLVRNLRIILTSQRTQGVVTGYESSSTQQGSPLYQMVAEYKTIDGSTHEARSTTRTNFSPQKKGDVVTIYYQPTKPNQAVIATFIDFWLHIVILGTIGCIIGLCWWGILNGITANGDIKPNGRTVTHYGSGEDRITEETSSTEE